MILFGHVIQIDDNKLVIFETSIENKEKKRRRTGRTAQTSNTASVFMNIKMTIQILCFLEYHVLVHVVGEKYIL